MPCQTAEHKYACKAHYILRKELTSNSIKETTNAHKQKKKGLGHMIK